MSGVPKRQGPPNAEARRPPIETITSSTNSSSPRAPSKSPVPGNANGIARSPSIRSGNTPVSARAAARKPPNHRSHLSSSAITGMSNEDELDDERAENAALVNDLKTQLQKAEVASEQYMKQLGMLQSRLDDALKEQGNLEDQTHEKDVKIERLQTQIKESTKQRKELEQTYEADRTTLIQEREQQASQEEELHFTIQRLKETLAQKDLRSNVESEGQPSISRSSSFRHRPSPDIENGQFAPSAALQRSPSRNNSKVILQKDKVIESLRLELAEAQIRLVEMENMGDGRLQELERTLLETRMANARLMEDNESFQLLLSEKTLNGDFTKGDFLSDEGCDDKPSGLGSLADELESAGERESENYRRLETEMKSLKDQNKALTLYIERIIGRLLQHEGFEAILDKADSPLATTKPVPNVEKELPPPPPAKDEPPPTPAAAAPSFLQRARSVVSRPNPAPKARPTSYMPTTQVTPVIPTAHENPNTAPSIPIGRSAAKGHQRSRSDQMDPSAATVVGQMYKGPAATMRSPSGGSMSPGISPASPGLTTQRSNTYFQLPVHPTAGSVTGTSPAVSRVASSTGGENRPSSSSNSIISEHSGEPGDKASPPRANNYTGTVMTQNKLRPLRLVQENKEMGSGDQGGGIRASDDEDTVARKKANRGSWMGWMGSLTRVGTGNLDENQSPVRSARDGSREGRGGSRERSVE